MFFPLETYWPAGCPIFVQFKNIQNVPLRKNAKLDKKSWKLLNIFLFTLYLQTFGTIIVTNYSINIFSK